MPSGFQLQETEIDIKKNSALANTKSGGNDMPMVKTIGCAYCWRAKNRAFLRSCGKPNPVLLAA